MSNAVSEGRATILEALNEVLTSLEVGPSTNTRLSSDPVRIHITASRCRRSPDRNFTVEVRLEAQGGINMFSVGGIQLELRSLPDGDHRELITANKDGRGFNTKLLCDHTYKLVPLKPLARR
ncbi:MAG: hypothetical protein HY459_00070 [Parcubacteria group bacterium]|nr:hypothetical protein [Parcubacteria group bacterium]